MRTPDNSFGAFCTDQSCFVAGSVSGSLSGLTFAAKDVFDIAGYRTGAGNPDWLRTHPVAQTTASAVRHLLDAGATLVGKTHTDELTFSLNGENYHYGTPVNPNAPGRIPGGSSSGSAAATAGQQVDFALGTDTGGSVRLPASNCGVFGFRPTHGAIPNDHVVPLAPSFDTVGWFACSGDLLQRVGRVLLPGETAVDQAPRLLLARDAFGLVYDNVETSLGCAVEVLEGLWGTAEEVSLYEGKARQWMTSFRTLQGAEIWQTHGPWIEKARPDFGPDIRDRFRWAASIDTALLPHANEVRTEVTQHLDQLLGPNGILCLPTSPAIALVKGASSQEQEEFRSRALTLLCVAGLAGVPQVSLPLVSCAGCPIGISLIAPRNSDLWLLSLTLTGSQNPNWNSL